MHSLPMKGGAWLFGIICFGSQKIQIPKMFPKRFRSQNVSQKSQIPKMFSKRFRSPKNVPKNVPKRFRSKKISQKSQIPKMFSKRVRPRKNVSQPNSLSSIRVTSMIVTFLKRPLKAFVFGQKVFGPGAEP